VITVALCAGFATRLYPLTRDFPKPLLEIRGRPILEDLVSQLAATKRISEIVIVSNSRFFERFRAWRDVAAKRFPGVRIDVLDDGAWDNENRLGAVGDLGFAVDRRQIGESALVMAGDNLFRFPIDRFLDDYLDNPRNLILVYREEDHQRLRRTGVAEIGPDSRLQRFQEKPANPLSEWACPALYILEARALSRVDRFLAQAPEKDAPGHFIAWLAEREPVFTHEMRGRRFDIGNMESYRDAERWLDEVDGNTSGKETRS
jgi:glucose-1-phosphate thymidylyltransferase